MANELVIFVADAGSVSKNNYIWVSSRDTSKSSNDPEDLAISIADELKVGNRVALGYESPLFIPVEAEKAKLGKARNGECQKETGNRPFNAGAGASVLATGIQSLAWVLLKIRELYRDAEATTKWDDFLNGEIPLFVWEAFVSGSEKANPPSHEGDAKLAIAAFRETAEKKDNPTRIQCARAFSLAGAAIIRSGLSDDLELLSEPCVVLRPIFSEKESNQRLKNPNDR